MIAFLGEELQLCNSSAPVDVKADSGDAFLV
jgi:hypothetical protein